MDIVTPRLCLRAWQDSDLPALVSLLGDAQTMAHWPQPYDQAGARDWLRRAQHSMAEWGFARSCCVRLSDNQIVGDVGIMRMDIQGTPRFDLGYIIHRDYWRQGYALEACRGLVTWAQEQRLPELVATMATDNLPSAGVAQKLGMRLEDTFVNPRNAGKETYFYRLSLPLT
ncbi:MAG: GNAT family N-acetyltransferase [Pseudomonadota bacterium]